MAVAVAVAIAVVFGAQEAPISDVLWGGNPSSNPNPNPEKSNKWYFFLLEGEGGRGREKEGKKKKRLYHRSRDTTGRTILYIRVTLGLRVTYGIRVISCRPGTTIVAPPGEPSPFFYFLFFFFPLFLPFPFVIIYLLYSIFYSSPDRRSSYAMTQACRFFSVPLPSPRLPYSMEKPARTATTHFLPLSCHVLAMCCYTTLVSPSV